VADGIEFPNGMAVTPDNATFIVAESFAGRLTAFDIEEDGSLSGRRVWAGGVGPDSICLDAEGAVWTHAADTRAHTGLDSSPAGACVRVREGGEVLARIETDRAGFACALGGPDRRTLFMLTADWRGIDLVETALADRTGQVLVAAAPAPGVGWP
jgi:sugar lactone lactonase YvrE